MNLIREKRQAKGWSLRQFAAKMECSAMYLCDVENGHRHFGPKLRRRAMLILNLKNEDFKRPCPRCDGTGMLP